MKTTKKAFTVIEALYAIAIVSVIVVGGFSLISQKLETEAAKTVEMIEIKNEMMNALANDDMDEYAELKAELDALQAELDN